MLGVAPVRSRAGQRILKMLQRSSEVVQPELGARAAVGLLQFELLQLLLNTLHNSSARQEKEANVYFQKVFRWRRRWQERSSLINCIQRWSLHCNTAAGCVTSSITRTQTSPFISQRALFHSQRMAEEIDAYLSQCNNAVYKHATLAFSG